MRGAIKARDVEAIAEFDLRFHGLIVELVRADPAASHLVEPRRAGPGPLVPGPGPPGIDRHGTSSRTPPARTRCSWTRCAAGTRRRPRRWPGSTSSRCRRCWPGWAGRDASAGQRPRAGGDAGLSLADLREACRRIDPEPIADLTLDLLRIWSPPGHEAEMAERLAAELSDAGATRPARPRVPGQPERHRRARRRRRADHPVARPPRRDRRRARAAGAARRPASSAAAPPT